MNEIPTPIILEVEGVLEDVLTEVFHKRVYPMLNAAPAGAVRLVVTTQPDLFQGGLEGEETFFIHGGPDREAAFTWKRSGSLSEVVQQFRTEFLGSLDARALGRHVLFGIYNAEFKPAPERAVADAATPHAEAAPAETDAPEQEATQTSSEHQENVMIAACDETKEGERESAPAGEEEKPWWDDSMAPDAPPIEHAPVEPVAPDVVEGADIADIIIESSAMPAPVEPAAEAADIADIADIIEAPSKPSPVEAPQPADTAEAAAAPVSAPDAPAEPVDIPTEAPTETAPQTEPVETGEQEPEAAPEPVDTEPAPEPLETAPVQEEAAAPEQEAQAEPTTEETPPAETNEPTEPSETVTPTQAGEQTLPAVEPEAVLFAEPLLLAPSRSRALGGDYLEFFGFATPPFSNELETAHHFSTPHRQAILADLLDAVIKRPGGALATGPRGCGLTTLGHELRGRLPEQFQSATVDATELMTPTQLLRAIAAALGCETEGLGRAALLESIRQLSRDWQGAGGGVCILIDDAERLEPDALEVLQQIVDGGPEKEPSEAGAPPRILLVGRPELRKNISRRELRGLRSHLAVERKLPAFGRKETAQYIQHRLVLADPHNPIRFTRGAIRAAYRYSGGAPRLINALCDRALRAVCADRERRITRGRIREAARTLELRSQGSPLARIFQFW